LICADCEAAREAPGYRLFSPLCAFCGGRLIRQIGKLQRPREELTERRKRVLADWVAYGHSETDLRALAKSGPAFPPVPEAPKRGR
jgi:hypothetical protein